MKAQAKITSKGQITIPRDVRRALGVRPGDKLVFEKVGNVIHIRPVKDVDPFEKYRGIGNPGIPSGRKGILRYIEKMRGR
jgi:AbrB family looped-hinge helix DNA binding protein